eukprot:8367535-Alexandrium_andersonii.AAC.1
MFNAASWLCALWPRRHGMTSEPGSGRASGQGFDWPCLRFCTPQCECSLAHGFFGISFGPCGRVHMPAFPADVQAESLRFKVFCFNGWE